MKYNKFQDLEISALGMGCMRFPVIDGKLDQIDVPAVEEMFAYCMEKGINYYDTAWGYHDGQSEIVTGKVLSKYPRDSYYLASKFPGYDINNMDKVEEIFEEQLKKCGVEYFDFYMFHNVCEMNIDEYLDPEYKIYEYLMEQKKNGRIKHLGFSTHASFDTFKEFLDAYGDSMEFCQIQLNWVDWDFQDAKAKVELLNEMNIPIFVMEPMRGGSLAKIEEEYEAKLKELRPDWTVPEWGFRYIQSIPGVALTLSGMSDMQQTKENIATFETHQPLSEAEMATLYEVAKAKTSAKSVPCTACNYCTSYCVKGLDIPKLIALYNEHVYSNGGFIAPMLIGQLPEDKRPSVCGGCALCETVCPQGINISEIMADFSERLGKSET